MATITTIGLDLAKLVFSTCEQDAVGRIRQRKDLRRGAHYWARRCLAYGLQPKLIAASL